MNPKYKTDKKAQIKMFETFAVLVIFFFLLVFGVRFYFILQANAYERQVERNAQLTSIRLTQKISNLPELDCTQIGIQINNCFDKLKLDSFSTMLNDPRTRLEYFDVLGYSTVAVRQIYPTEAEFTLYNRELGNATHSYKNNIPVLIYNPISDDYSFGVLEATIYVRKQDLV